MSGSPERDDERPATPPPDSPPPETGSFFPVDPGGFLREAIAAGDLDAQTVLSALVEEGTLDPGILTQFSASCDTIPVDESEERSELAGPDRKMGSRLIEVGVLGQGGMPKVGRSSTRPARPW